MVLAVEHVAMLESREPDAIKVEAPNDHVGVGMEGREAGRRDDEGEERRRVVEDIELGTISTGAEGVGDYVSAGVNLLTPTQIWSRIWQRPW